MLLLSRALSACLCTRQSSVACTNSCIVFGHPAGWLRWRPVWHKGSSSSSTSVSGFLRFSFHHVLRFSLVCCRTRCRCGDHFFHFAYFACWLVIASCIVMIGMAAPASFPLVWSRIVSTSTSFSRFISSHFLATISMMFTGGSCCTCIASRLSLATVPFQPCHVFLCCWSCSLGHFVQPRINFNFDGSCLGLVPLQLDLVPDVRSRSPWSRHFCSEEDLATR